MEILIDAEAKFPRRAAIPYNLACYYCQLGEMEKAKRYLKEAFEIDLNWRKAALDDEDLRPFWDSFPFCFCDTELFRSAHDLFERFEPLTLLGDE
jgi:tetratricopeptide (TPR) repeat protein